MSRRVLVVAGTVLGGCKHPSTAPLARTPTAEVVLCEEPSTPPRQVWHRASELLTEAYLDKLNASHGTSISVRTSRECDPLPPGVTCRGVPGVVECRADAISRTTQATAWLAVGAAVRFVLHPPEPGAAPAGSRRVIGVDDAFELADTTLRNDNAQQQVFSRILSRMPFTDDARAQTAATELVAVSVGVFSVANWVITFPPERWLRGVPRCKTKDDEDVSCLHDWGAEETVQDRLLAATTLAFIATRDANDYLMSFVLGHELAHALSACPIAQESWSEQAGRFGELLQFQLRGDGGWRAPVSVSEEQADRCAMRVVEWVDRTLVAEAAGDQQRTSLLETLHGGRRFAIEIGAWIFHAGLGAPPALRVTWGVRGFPEYAIQAPEGYLLPGLRTILLSQYLTAIDDDPDRTLVNLCHETARRILLGFEATRSLSQTAPMQQALATALGPYWPESLRARMQGAALDLADPSTFVCDPQHSQTERGRDKPPWAH